MKSSTLGSTRRKSTSKGKAIALSKTEPETEMGTGTNVETLRALSAKIYLGTLTAADVAEAFGLTVGVIQNMRDDSANQASFPQICDYWKVRHAIREDLRTYLRILPVSPSFTRVDLSVVAQLAHISEGEEFTRFCKVNACSVTRMGRLCDLFRSGGFVSAPGRKRLGKAKTGPTHTGTQVLKDLHLPTLQRCTTFGEKHVILIADLLAAGCKPIEVTKLISGQHSRQVASNVWIVATAIRYGRSWSRHPNHDRIQAVVEKATKEGTLGKVDWLELSRLARVMDAD